MVSVMILRATLLSRSRLLIPDRGRLPQGLWMHAACRPLVLAASNLTGHLARVSVRLVPGRSIGFAPWIAESTWKSVMGDLSVADGHIVALRPSDRRRARMLLLVLDTSNRPVAFAKISRNPPNRLANLALDRLREHHGVIAPRVRDAWQVEDWWISVEDPLPQRSHKPVRLSPRDRFEVCEAISSLVPEQADGDMAFVHGDLGPWNLREFAGIGRAILDWDDACQAPRAADALWHAMNFPLARRPTERGVFPRANSALKPFYAPAELAQAARFWLKRWQAESAEILPGVAKSADLMEREVRRTRILEAFAALS